MKRSSTNAEFSWVLQIGVSMCDNAEKASWFNMINKIASKIQYILNKGAPKQFLELN